MASIPQYQRQRLASSVVGTPGVDTSNADAFNSVARASASMSDSAFRIAAQRQEAIDKTEALKKASDFELVSFKILDEHTRQYSEDPTNKTDILKEKLNDQLNGILETTTSPRVKNMIQSTGLNVIGNSALKEMSWAHNQQASLALTNIVSTVNNRANELYVAGQQNDLNRFSEVMSSIPAVLNTAKGVLSPEQMLKLKTDTPKSLANGFLQGAMDKNPAMAAQLLKDGVFDYFGSERDGSLVQILTLEEKGKYLETANNRIAKLGDMAAYTHLTNIMNQQDELVKKVGDDTLTLTDVESIQDPATQKVFRDIYEKINPMSNEAEGQIADELYEDYYKMTKNRIEKKDSSKKAKFEDLIAFRNKVYKNFDHLSESQRNQFLKEIIPTITKRIKKGEKSKDQFATGIADIKAWVARIPQGGAYINGQPITDERDAGQLRSSAVNQYIDQLKMSVGRKNKQGIPLSPAEVLNEVKRSFSNPEWAAYKEGDLISSNNLTYKVVGFDPDTGEPLTIQVPNVQ